MSSEEEQDQETEEGMSMPKKVAAGAAIGVAIPTAVKVAKKLIGDNGGDGDGAEDQPMSRDEAGRDRQRESGGSSTSPSRSSAKKSGSTSRSRSSAKKASSTSRSRSSTKKTSSSSSGRNRTREQLYKQATRLKIEGRSSMSKAELERAVDRAKKK